MTPSPIRLVTSTPSARTSISATRAMEPLEITASFRARSSESTFSPRSTRTESIIRSSVRYSPAASRVSRLSSPRSSSAIKPTLPMFTPRMGTSWRVASRAAWRMVPSPPKQSSTSARFSSSSMLPSFTCRGRSSRSPFLGAKGRQRAVSAPALFKILRASSATRRPLSR